MGLWSVVMTTPGSMAHKAVEILQWEGYDVFSSTTAGRLSIALPPFFLPGLCPSGVSFARTGAWTKIDLAGLSHIMHLKSTLRLSLEQVWVCDGPSLWADGTFLILC